MTGNNKIYFSKASALILSSTLLLSACMEGDGFNPFKPRDTAETEQATQAAVTRTVERDVEAPDVFQKSDRGLWDGRPSLGGVWIAHEDVSEPERVIIRNEADGKFVVGALFRRERLTPGPEFQVSSAAAEALGMLAGQPANLQVTALRREEIVETTEPAPGDVAIPEAEEIEETTLDPIAAAAAAIDGAGDTTAATTSAPVAAVPATTAASSLSKPYIQIGIFSVEANANSTAASMRDAGVSADVRTLTSNGREFWRVVVGPSATSSDRAALLNKVKEMGFADAYFVTR